MGRRSNFRRRGAEAQRRGELQQEKNETMTNVYFDDLSDRAKRMGLIVSCERVNITWYEDKIKFIMEKEPGVVIATAEGWAEGHTFLSINESLKNIDLEIERVRKMVQLRMLCQQNRSQERRII